MFGSGLSIIRHGQSLDPCLDHNAGVYKSMVFGVFTANSTDSGVSATAIWVLHFMSGNTRFCCLWANGNTPS